MEELVTSINTITSTLKVNLDSSLHGNKSAAVRARKNTLELERLYKQYRKTSVEAFKK